MKYRKFGPLNWEVSALALGMARLPKSKRASVELIRRAADLGINYLDLGYPYDMERQERLAGIVGEALGRRLGGAVKVSVTLPSHDIFSASDLESHLSRQLTGLGADRADFCLFGRLNRDNWPTLQSLGALSWMETAMKEGRVAHAGFSFHDHYQVLRGILASWDRWSFVQFQFSYMDVRHDPGVVGIRHAARQGPAVVVTEPLKRGRLSHRGLEFVWNHSEVATAVRDIGSIAELAADASLADASSANSMSVEDELEIARLRDEFLARRPLECTSCRACMPCPEGIDVPRVFEIYNDAFMYEDTETARRIYDEEGHRADRCTFCGSCDKSCAKSLPVVEWLVKAHRMLKDEQ